MFTGVCGGLDKGVRLVRLVRIIAKMGNKGVSHKGILFRV